MDDLNLQINSNITKDLDALNQGQLSLFEQAYNPDVLDCLSSLSNDEVFTSPKLANQMLDLLPSEIWSNPKATFLDPVSKSGVFLREIVKRLDKGLKSQIPDKQTRINHILKNQVFGIAITQLTALLSRRSVYCAKEANSRLSICTGFDDDMGNIIFGQVEHIFQDGKCTQCGASEAVFGERKGLENHAYAFIHTNKSNQYKELEKMKFDVIIGNPPYQLSDGGAGASAAPIYHKFIEQAKKLNPNYLIMITPSRWFAGGKGLDEFRDNMLNDKRMKYIVDFIDSKECFPSSADISGGVNYFLWDRNHNGDCTVCNMENGIIVSEMKRSLNEGSSDTFIRFNKAVSILRKVKGKKQESFSQLVSSRKPFGFDTTYKGFNQSKDKTIKLHTSNGIKYVGRSDILRNVDWIDNYKVYISRAYGERISSDFWVLGKPFLGEPKTACTETYLVIGNFENEQICQNVMSYIRTRFFRFLVLLKKNTQDGTSKVYEFVPMQDFTQSWTDEKLYQKYGLSKDEIAFIESMIRPMDNDTSEKVKKSRGKKTAQSQLDLESGE